MSEDRFDKLIREELFDFSLPAQSDWEDLSSRMAARARQKRRTRFLYYAGAAAACLALLFALIWPGRSSFQQSAATSPIALVGSPNDITPSLSLANYVEPLLSQQQMSLMHQKLTAAYFKDVQTFTIVPPDEIKQVADSLTLQIEDKIFSQLADAQEPDLSPEETLSAPKKQNKKSTFIPPDPLPRNRQYKKWVTGATMSYQGPINGNYIFTPSTYTTKWETPLSMSGTNLDNLDIAQFLADRLETDQVNTISTHFSTPISAGVSVQKEFNKWLSVGASLTYTLLRGEYQAITEDKSYILNQNTHYLGIPVGLYFHAVNTPYLSVYAVGGGAIDRALADEYECQLNGVTSRQRETVQGFQFSVFGGLGIEYKCTDLLGIYVEPSVSHYFDNNQPKSLRTIQPTQFKVEIGFRFRI